MRGKLPVFIAKPSQKTLNKFGKPSRTLIILKKTRIYRLIASAIDSGFACQTVTIRVFSIDEIIITKLQKYVNPLFYFVKNRYCIFVLLCVLSDIFTFYPVFLYFFFSAIKRQIVYSTLFRDSTISIFFNF